MHPDTPIDIKFKRGLEEGFPYYLGRNGTAESSGLHLTAEFPHNGQQGRLLSPVNGRGDVSLSCRIFIPTEALYALAVAILEPR